MSSWCSSCGASRETVYGFARTSPRRDRRDGGGMLSMDDGLVTDVDYADPSNDAHAALLRLVLRESPPHPYEYPRSLMGLDTYLHACRISHFRAAELCLANVPTDGLEVALPTDPLTGRAVLLPARHAWPRAACILSLAELIRQRSGPLKVKHWWRPSALNAAVGGAAGSDHLSASAIDFAARDADELAEAVALIVEPLWRAESACPVWGLSLGHRAGSTVIHIGCWAPRTIDTGRARRWGYDTTGKVIQWSH